MAFCLVRPSACSQPEWPKPGSFDGEKRRDRCCPCPHLTLVAVAQGCGLCPSLLSVLLCCSLSSLRAPKAIFASKPPFYGWLRLPLSVLLFPQNLLLTLTFRGRNTDTIFLVVTMVTVLPLDVGFCYLVTWLMEGGRKEVTTIQNQRHICG